MGDAALASYVLKNKDPARVDSFAICFCWGVAAMIGITASASVSGNSCTHPLHVTACAAPHVHDLCPYLSLPLVSQSFRGGEEDVGLKVDLEILLGFTCTATLLVFSHSKGNVKERKRI